MHEMIGVLIWSRAKLLSDFFVLGPGHCRPPTLRAVEETERPSGREGNGSAKAQ